MLHVDAKVIESRKRAALARKAMQALEALRLAEHDDGLNNESADCAFFLFEALEKIAQYVMIRDNR